MIRLRTLLAFILLAVPLAARAGGQAGPSLLPNGGVEDKFVNDIEQLPGYGSRIHPGGRSYVPHWELSEGAVTSESRPHGGTRCLELLSGAKDVTAALRSDFWQVKDPAMPFGLPLVPDAEIRISFFYRISGEVAAGALKCRIRIGTVEGLPSDHKEIALVPSDEWRRHEVVLRTTGWKWGAEIRFVLAAQEAPPIRARVDDVELRQDLGVENVVTNGGFEDPDMSGIWPEGWTIPREDQWVSWVGSTFRPPAIEENESVSGRRSVRASVTYAEISGLSQRIRLNQPEVRPVLLAVRSKLDNSIGNSPPGYWGPNNLANLTVFVHFADGTMQEVSPTFSLGVSDHDWDYRRFGFRPLKPIEEMDLRFTVIGSEPTTSLFLDEVEAGEWGAGRDDLARRGTPAPPRSVTAAWGDLATTSGEAPVRASNDESGMTVDIPVPEAQAETRLYLNPDLKSTGVNHRRYLFSVLRIPADGAAELGEAVEKQGYVVEGLFVKAATRGVEVVRRPGGWAVRVPFRALGLAGVPPEPIGLNIAWRSGMSERLWTGTRVNSREMGRLVLARRPGLRVQAVSFGRRFFEDTDQTQDFVSHPQICAGLNEAEIVLLNDGPSACQAAVTAGVRGERPGRATVAVDPGRSRTVRLAYETGSGQSVPFDLTIETGDGGLWKRTYPLLVPEPVEIVLDQEFYYPEETQAAVEVHNRKRPVAPGGRVRFEVRDLVSRERVASFEQPIEAAVSTCRFDIGTLRLNPLPVQDYELIATYRDAGDREIGRGRAVFGRIRRTERRPLPPIRRLRLDERGRIIINDNFRFFPIVPSVNVMDWDEAIDLGANVFRGSFTPAGTYFQETERAWKKNAYTMTIGPGSPGSGEETILDLFKKDAPRLLAHPGFLSCYAKQFYYWKLPQSLRDYRARVEDIVAALPSPRLVIWGHHDSSLLYDREDPPRQIADPPVGYCYVKIMGRPGSMWRNTPFLTKTERILNPRRFLLAEVNYYVSFHGDEVVPEQYPGYLSLRGDDWRGVRAESYLGVIYGANGSTIGSARRSRSSRDCGAGSRSSISCGPSSSPTTRRNRSGSLRPILRSRSV